MRSLRLYWVDAFTNNVFSGNQAAVIVNADSLSEDEKQRIAKELNLSETIFVSESKYADYKVQFFTPKQETALCGHGTIATFWVLGSIGVIEKSYDGLVYLKQETKAGILPIEIHYKENNLVDKIIMDQTLPYFSDLEIDKNEISKILGISICDFENNYPLKVVSTGRPKLFIPIRSREILYSITPNFNSIADFCIKNSITGFHLFTFDTHHPDSITTARHFAPIAGVNEDPVTGIAAGALGCYLLEFGNIVSSEFRMEQGYNLKRNGTIYVKINKDKEGYKSVKVGGQAHILFNTEILLK